MKDLVNLVRMRYNLLYRDRHRHGLIETPVLHTPEKTDINGMVLSM